MALFAFTAVVATFAVALVLVSGSAQAQDEGDDRYGSDFSKLDPKLQEALKSDRSVVEQINGWSNEEINRAFNGPKAFSAIYNHRGTTSLAAYGPSAALSRSKPKYLDAEINRYVDHEQIRDGSRHLTKGVQDYVKWATGITPNNELSKKQQQANFDEMLTVVQDDGKVKGALDRDNVTDETLSTDVEKAGVGMDPEIWKHAPSASLVTLKGGRRGTWGVGRALNAREELNSNNKELQNFLRQEGQTQAFIEQFNGDQLNYNDPSTLNGWYPDQTPPADGGEMRSIMMSLDPAVLSDMGRDYKNSLFVQDVVEVQQRENQVQQQAEEQADAANDAREARAAQVAEDAAETEAAREESEANAEPLPKLNAEEQKILDYFELGEITNFTDESGKVVSGRYTFENAPEGRWVAEKNLDKLLYSLAADRFMLKMDAASDSDDVLPQPPATRGLKAQAGAGQTQKFNLLLGGAAVKDVEALPNVGPNTKAITEWLAKYLGGEYTGVFGWPRDTWGDAKPAFFAARFTNQFFDSSKGFVGAPPVLRDRLIPAAEFERAKKAIEIKGQVHFDVAPQIRNPGVMLYARAEGNVAENILGAGWQAARFWRGGGPGGGGPGGGGPGGGRPGGGGPGGGDSDSFRTAPSSFGEQLEVNMADLEQARQQAAEAANAQAVDVEQQVDQCEAGEGVYESAADEGLTCKINRDDGNVDEGKSSYTIKYPTTVTETAGTSGKELSIDPDVRAMLKEIGVSSAAIDDSLEISASQQRSLNSISTGTKIALQLIKPFGVAGFTNVNAAFGTNNNGAYVDYGVAIPYTPNKPFGGVGTDPENDKKFVGGRGVWVFGGSTQIIGSRTDDGPDDSAGGNPSG